jgi:hypothetical protein
LQTILKYSRRQALRWNAAGAEPLTPPLVFIMPFVMFVAIFMGAMKMFVLVDRNRPGATEGHQRDRNEVGIQSH